MNKPDWKSAPEWAAYLAMDADGSWAWFEELPEWDRKWRGWFRIGLTGRSDVVSRLPAPTESLEARPEGA